jgi:hypothetical protein
MANNSLPFQIPPPPYIEEPLPVYTPSDPAEPSPSEFTEPLPLPLHVGFSLNFPTSLEPPIRVSRAIAVSAPILYTPPPIYSYMPNNRIPVIFTTPCRHLRSYLYTQDNDAHIDIPRTSQTQTSPEEIRTSRHMGCLDPMDYEPLIILFSILVIIGFIVGVTIAVIKLWK